MHRFGLAPGSWLVKNNLSGPSLSTISIHLSLLLIEFDRSEGGNLYVVDTLIKCVDVDRWHAPATILAGAFFSTSTTSSSFSFTQASTQGEEGEKWRFIFMTGLIVSYILILSFNSRGQTTRTTTTTSTLLINDEKKDFGVRAKALLWSRKPLLNRYLLRPLRTAPHPRLLAAVLLIIWFRFSLMSSTVRNLIIPSTQQPEQSSSSS